MAWSKEEQREDTDRLTAGTLAAVETLRSASVPVSASPAPKGEERISVFWRVFGGTLLSIAALTIVTVYQQFASTLSELRGGIAHINESQADLVKKDDFTRATTSIWNSVKALQLSCADTTTTNRVSVLETQLHAAEADRKDLTKQVSDLRERLAKLEGQAKSK
jgi:septal ring factor EnvC (AmiA/AmiB activator)